MKDIVKVIVLTVLFCSAVLIVAVLFPALASAHDDVAVSISECGQHLAVVAQIDGQTYVVRRGDSETALLLVTALANAPDTVTAEIDIGLLDPGRCTAR